MTNGIMFEDWWVHPGIFQPATFSKLKSLDLKQKDHREIIFAISAFASSTLPALPTR